MVLLSRRGVCASTKYTTPNKLLVVSNGNVLNMNEQIKILETTRPMTVKIGIENDPIVEDCNSEMTQPTLKGLIKQVDSIDLIVAMLKVLSLDDKRKIKESEKEHFETFQAHRPYARSYAKRMKVSHN